MVVLRSVFAVVQLGVRATNVRKVGNRGYPLLQHARQFHSRRSSTAATQAAKMEQNVGVVAAVPTTSHSLKVIFSDHQACDFKYLWLRDNCHCHRCIHPDSKQKLVDTVALDYNVKPASFEIGATGNLEVSWTEDGHVHKSSYDPSWLYKYGKSFILDQFNPEEDHVALPPIEIWDRVAIWKNIPEVSYHEFIRTDDGLHHWLELIHKYGVAIMRDVPCNKGEIVNVVNRFAYIKSTIWGPTFDVICEPVQNDPSHLAYTGMYLEHHTDMNYRENSPGLQLLHCLKAHEATGSDHGGKSFFVDGFMIAKWLQETNPAAFHILSSTPIKFSIKSHSMKYSQILPVICLNNDGEVTEVHYNNRTMAPLQVPSHLVTPFYHALRAFAMKMREPSSELSFHMVPGDLVAFNNRRVLHGRTSFDSSKVTRHLQGCYVDIDEAFTRYRAMQQDGTH